MMILMSRDKMKNLLTFCPSTSSVLSLSLTNTKQQYLVFIVITILVSQLITTSVINTTEQQQDATNTNALDTKPPINRLLIMTLAKDLTSEPFQRFNQSVHTYELDLLVLGNELNDEKETQRIDLVRKALATYKNDKDLLVIVLADGEDIIFNGDKAGILDRFMGKFYQNTRIVFAADTECWPLPSLQSNYSAIVEQTGKSEQKARFLNSGAFIGYAPYLWQLLNLNHVEKKNKVYERNNFEQIYYTEAYLSDEVRAKLGIQLDQSSELFQSLRLQEREVEIRLEGNNSSRLVNVVHNTEPLILNANGPSKVMFNSLGNYLAKSWTIGQGCRHCNESMISLGSTKDENLPTVLVGLFIEEPTPFFDEFLNSVYKLEYARNKMHLFVHNAVQYHDEKLEEFLKKYGHEYASQQVVRSPSNASSNSNGIQLSECEARNYALERCKELRCQYHLSLDSIARLDLPETLKILIEANKTVVGPMLSRPGKLWSNFWGAITSDGFYSRSFDYVELLKGERLGLWNVAHLMNAYLIEGSFIRRALENQLENNEVNESTDEQPLVLSYCSTLPNTKPVLTFTRNLRRANRFQFVLNTHDYGHLVDSSNFNTSLKHPDFYQLEVNTLDWERRYLHENYSKQVEPNTQLEKPCPDVIWFPLVSDRFCEETVEIMEHFGQWSGGTNDDPRIEGGYESVPTRDIHFKQVGLHQMWLTFVRDYVTPIQLKEFIGYEHVAEAELAFVVRYHPQEQASLQPHHDASTFTLNIALNTPHVDYEGGGCRFLRYNCSVTESRRGWGLIHPGRLTHYHEGLPVTNGTRYILVTFVDP